MSPSASEPPSDARLAGLLAERAWVGHLARSLVRDQALAEDLEQETWLAALTRPPRWRASPRGWLSRVLRNRAARAGRSGVRRGRREAAAARPEAQRATDEVVAAAEQHRRLVDALAELPEPGRTAVLLRYYEGLPPREIARRTGAPVETVRARVRRGVEALRERLDEREPRGRAAWMSALAPLITPSGPSVGPGGAGVLAGGASMSGKAWLATGLGLLLIGGAAVARWGGAGREAPDPRREAGAGPATGPGGTGTTAPTLLGSAEAGSPPAGPSPGAAPAAEARGPGLRVRWAGGEPAPEALVTLAGEQHRPDAQGFVPLPGHASPAPLLWVVAPGARPRRLADVDLSTGALVVELERAAPPLLSFVEGAGAPLAPEAARARYEAAGVTLEAAWLWPEALAPATPADVLAGLLSGAGRWRLEAAVGWDQGEPSLAWPAPVPGARLIVLTPAGVPWISPPTRDGAPVLVPLSTVGTLALRVLSEEGAPLPSARVTAFAEHGDDALFLRGRTWEADADGRLSLSLPETAAGSRAPSLLVEAPGRSLWVVQGLSARTARTGDPVELRVPPSATAEGHAYGADGRPAAGAQVVWAWRGFSRRAPVGADGAYRLEGLAPWSSGARADASRSVLLALLLPGAAEPAGWGKGEVRPGATTQVDVGQPAGSAAGGRLRGTVRAGGAPLAGVFLALQTRKGDGGGDRKRGFATSGADGGWSLDGLAPGTYDLLVLLGNPRVSDDYVLRASEPLTLEAGDERRLDVALPGGVLAVAVVDAATGAPVPQAMVVAEPERAEASEGAVPGFAGRLGGSAFADASGRARLSALLVGEPHRVRAAAQGWKEGQATGARPAAGPAPEVVLRLEAAR